MKAYPCSKPFENEHKIGQAMKNCDVGVIGIIGVIRVLR